MTQGYDPFPAQVKIEQLQTGSAPSGTELIEAVQTGVSVQLTLNQVVSSLITPAIVSATPAATAILPAAGATGQILQSLNTAGATWVNIAALVTAGSGIGISGSTTITVGLQTVAGLSVLARGAPASGLLSPVTGTTNQILRVSSTGILGFGAVDLATSMVTAAVATSAVYRFSLAGAIGFGPVDLSTSAAVTAVLSPAHGGIGFTTAVASSILGWLNATTVTAYIPGQLPGIATSADASTGNIGEYLSTTLAIASAKELTSGTATSVISLGLSPGDWDVFPVIGFTGHTSTLVYYAAGSLSNSSSVLNTTIGEGVSIPGFNLAMFTSTTVVNTPTVAVPPVRRALTATTTVWLTAQMGFATSTASAYGSIRARRAR